METGRWRVPQGTEMQDLLFNHIFLFWFAFCFHKPPGLVFIFRKRHWSIYWFYLSFKLSDWQLFLSWNIPEGELGFISSVAQSCPTLCDPMNHSTPSLPVHHQLSEFTQTHVHWIGDAIQPSHPMSSPSPPALNLSQHQGLFQWVSSSHQVAKVLEFQLQHQAFQWTPRTDLLSDGLVGSPCSSRDSQESSPTP